jgi:hypothetical protein
MTTSIALAFNEIYPGIIYIMQNENKEIEDRISFRSMDIYIEDGEDKSKIAFNYSLNKKFLDFIGYVNLKNDKIDPVMKLDTIIEKQVKIENVKLKYLKNDKYYTIDIKKAKGIIRANMFFIPADSVGFVNFELINEDDQSYIHFYYKLSTGQIFFNWLEEKDEEIQFLGFEK